MILEVKDLSFAYRKQEPVFSNVNFSLGPGEILTLLGPNGAGKTTLFNCIANLLSPTSGQVLLESKDVRQISRREAAKILGYVPQTHTPAYGYTVRDFVVMGRAPYLGMFRKPSARDYAQADQVMEDLHLTKLRDQPYTEISGGERQQATIARVIVQQPKLIMFDEPTNHLDYGNQLRTIKMVKELAKKGYAVVMTTHMPDHAILLGGKVGILDRFGHLTVGATEDILQEELLRSVYDCDLHITYSEEIGRKVCLYGRLD